jgi:hypothetical protein
MSINVEEIGGSLMIQHYIAEVHRADHCRMVSLSDLQTPMGWTKVQVIWDLSIAALNAETCTYSNRVVSYPTRGFLELLDSAGRTFDELLPDYSRQRLTTIGARPRCMRQASNETRWRSR